MKKVCVDAVSGALGRFVGRAEAQAIEQRLLAALREDAKDRATWKARTPAERIIAAGERLGAEAIKSAVDYRAAIDGRRLNQSAQAPAAKPSAAALRFGSDAEIADLIALADRGAGLDEITSHPVFSRIEAHVRETPYTLSEANRANPDFWASRRYVTPEGETDLAGAIVHLRERYESAAGGPPARERRAVLVSGHPGAGKSTFISAITRERRAAFIDADVAKELISEYEGGRNTQAVHAESAEIRGRVARDLVADGVNLVLERVGDDPASLEANLNELRAAGYQVELVLIDVSADEAARRMARRFVASGRYIEPATMKRVAGRPRPAFDALLEKNQFDGYIRIDADGPPGTAKLSFAQGAEDIASAIDAASKPERRADPGRPEDASGDGQGPGEEGRRLEQFAGARAATANRSALDLALEMSAGGESRERIWRETGWTIGDDGKWRFEIDTKEARLIVPLEPVAYSPVRRLDEVLDFPELFAAYPQLREIYVDLGRGKFGGFWSRGDMLIKVRARNSLDARGALLHEVQHAIQDIEGFADGGSPADVEGLRSVAPEEFENLVADEVLLRDMETRGTEWRRLIFQGDDARFLASERRHAAARVASDLYWRLSGEVEARDVAERATELSAAERRATPPKSGDGSPDRIVALSLPDDAFLRLKQDGERGPRGDVLIPPGGVFSDPGVLIRLFQNADRSTPLHEFGHVFLEMLGDYAARAGAPEALTRDWQAVLDWLGVKGREDISDAHHEKFARGFEAYLREGVAPSPSLASAFAAFKKWLTALYRTVMELDVELDDNIRGVFDRLVKDGVDVEGSSVSGRGGRAEGSTGQRPGGRAGPGGDQSGGGGSGASADRAAGTDGAGDPAQAPADGRRLSPRVLARDPELAEIASELADIRAEIAALEAQGAITPADARAALADLENLEKTNARPEMLRAAAFCLQYGARVEFGA